MPGGFYYWTYRSHPHSDEEFLYDGILPYVPNSHTAHKLSKDVINELDEPAVEYDLGVHMIIPINKLIREDYDVDDVSEFSLNSVDTEKLKGKVRDEINEEDVLEVGDRQERMDRHQMGEDVDGIIDIEEP